MADESSLGSARDPLRFLNGGGALGDLIRSRDWSGSPLGLPHTWPQSLRTTLSLCLASSFPLCFAWGEGRIQFYNDGYLPLCGAKHPHSLGQDFRECWLSAWPVIGPAFEHCVRTGEASYLKDSRMFIDRNGYLEETFFTFSFSPIRDESGEIAGVFHPVVESTHLVLSERRLGLLRDVASRASEAKQASSCLQMVANALSAHGVDVPFALFYALEDDVTAGDGAKVPTLVASVGVDADALEDRLSKLPLERAAEMPTTEVDDPRGLLGDMVCDPYPEPIRTIVTHRVMLGSTGFPLIVMVVGASPRLSFDDGYRGFLEMLGAAVTTAVSKAHTYAEERRRAEKLADIDDRVRADDALRTSEQRFRSMFELAAVGIAQSDARTGRLLLCNDKLCKISGYSREELSAISQAEVAATATASAGDEHLTLFAKAVVADARASIHEKLFLRKDGAPVCVRINAAVMRDAAGIAITVMYVIEDVTARKQAEEKLQRFNAVLEGLVRGRTVELEAANKELEAFAYSVSHDLRAPLRAIEGFSKILSERFASEIPEAAREYLDEVRSNTTYMGRLVSDLLAFSRLGRQPVRKIKVDTNEVVRGCLSDLQYAREGREVDVVIADLPPCEADPFLLKQVFVNLLSNAFKYTSKRPHARIEVGYRASREPSAAGVGGGPPSATNVTAENDDITFFVRDDGVGFDMRYAHKLFAVFRRLHSAEEYEGTGVGLAIVQRIVQKHGGRVWADAAPGRGATLNFTLPRAGVAHDGQ